jgi:hypothetical protein
MKLEQQQQQQQQQQQELKDPSDESSAGRTRVNRTRVNGRRRQPLCVKLLKTFGKRALAYVKRSLQKTKRGLCVAGAVKRPMRGRRSKEAYAWQRRRTCRQPLCQKLQRSPQVRQKSPSIRLAYVYKLQRSPQIRQKSPSIRKKKPTKEVCA